jgi:hypothetical protein
MVSSSATETPSCFAIFLTKGEKNLPPAEFLGMSATGTLLGGA